MLIEKDLAEARFLLKFLLIIIIMIMAQKMNIKTIYIITSASSSYMME